MSLNEKVSVINDKQRIMLDQIQKKLFAMEDDLGKRESFKKY